MIRLWIIFSGPRICVRKKSGWLLAQLGCTEARLGHYPKADAYLKEALEKGYDTRCTDDLFSQGQWQLLSIARAAAAAPSMLLFDEITANLDAETERAVLSALKRVAENRTVISISHRTSAELGRIIALTD